MTSTLRDIIVKAITDDAQLPLEERRGIVAAVQDAVKPMFDQVAAERDGAYTERARLVAYLASRHPSHIGFTDPTAPEWAVVIVETGAGQMSWHVAPQDRELFDHVVPTGPLSRAWDGHTTNEKYERLAELTDRG